MKRWAYATFIAVALLAGLTIRWTLRSHVSGDARVYLLPWYAFVRAHGLGSLRYAFSNYPPYYTYVLLVLTRLEGLATPLILIKAVSVLFELACAMMAARIARSSGGGRWAGACGFAGVWLAPTALLNGSYWAQSDSLWTFFVLVSLMLFMQGRNGVPAFALAFAVKLQCIFFGPFMLGRIVRRRALWPWLAVVPVVYLVVALPVLIAGRPLGSVLSIYLDQANTYHLLSLNAANFWIFGPVDETLGTVIGLISATLAGIFIAVMTARIAEGDHEGLMVAACASLLMMPFLLPKMHDRYFYAFEIASIALACANPRYVALAVIAQANGVLSYMMFDEGLPLETLAPAAICNAGMALLLIEQMLRPRAGRRMPRAALAAFFGAAVLMLGILATWPRHGALRAYPLFATAFSLLGVTLLWSTRREGPPPTSAAAPVVARTHG
jgi:Gpi18-like mannosyltransferase